MKFFINQNNDVLIPIFSKYHFIIILLTFLFVTLVILNKDKIKNLDCNKKRKIRLLLAVILIFNLVIRRGSFLYFGVYNWKYHLDINFCNFTSLLFVIYGISGNKKIYNIAYYMAFVGPLLSILIPSASMKPLNYSFYSYLVIHHVIFVFNFIFMFMENKKYDKKDFIHTMWFVIMYFVSTYIFNYFMQTEYNMPLTFFNDIFLTNGIINNLTYNNIFVFGIFIIVIFTMLSIGKYNLKQLNK